MISGLPSTAGAGSRSTEPRSGANIVRHLIRCPHWTDVISSRTGFQRVRRCWLRFGVGGDVVNALGLRRKSLSLTASPSRP